MLENKVVNADEKKLGKVKSSLIGRVISTKMDKTAVIKIDRRVKHQVLGKIITLSSKYKAHDENNQYNMGDIVEIQECRPLSRSKSWKILRLIQKSKI